MIIKSGIYAIINIVNDKLYVGSSIYIKDRWHLHRKQLNNNKHHNKYLQRSWNKYGERNFIFTVIEFCMWDFLLERENFWIKELSANYNTHLTAGSPLGYKHSEETRAKMRLRQTSEEQRKAISEANKRRVGIKYKTTNEHTSRCKCDICITLKNQRRKKWRDKQKLENPEHYREQQRKWDKNKNKDKTKIFILVPDGNIME